MQPEEEALLADTLGLALLAVLDTLTPDERLAFVLHDMFDLPFSEIGACWAGRRQARWASGLMRPVNLRVSSAAIRPTTPGHRRYLATPPGKDAHAPDGTPARRS